MGQYFKVVFLSDVPKEGQEEIRAYSEADIGVKLMEHSYQNYVFMNSIESILIPEGLFYKTRLVWAGDYAEDEDDSANLYHLAENSICHNSFPLEYSYKHEEYPFIDNHTKKEYVDKQTIYKFELLGDYDKNPIHPLPLLTAEGNGQGRGDYEGINMELVGRWARDSISVEKTPPDGFTQLECDFREE